jgi:dTDP-4-dehydrorhamnose reductase
MQEMKNLMELWGGIECSINRVKDHYSNQLALQGHCTRYCDIAKFAELGIKTLRYPVLWEGHQDEKCWIDTRIHLNKCHENGITPINWFSSSWKWTGRYQFAP